MWDDEQQRPCDPRNWALSDDLGQIEYLFSDKTGTLTRNLMEWRQCSIGGKVYGILEPDEQTIALFQERRASLGLDTTVLPTLVDPTLYDDLERKDEQSRRIIDFFTLVAVCHTVLIERHPVLEAEVTRVPKYQAQSPDEAALVACARDLGFAFAERQSGGMLIVDIVGRGRDAIQVMTTLEFTSDRKRMSVIVQRRDGTLWLWSKGADSVIFDRLAPNDPFLVNSQTQLGSFAEAGLRTLCLATRPLSAREWNGWHTRWVQASASLQNRIELMDEVANELEQQLSLLGTTAIEDRLAEGVPESIATLRAAGIRVWVLTGDKLETAVNVGMSCRLLDPRMLLLMVRANSVEGCLSQLREARERLLGRRWWDAEETTDGFGNLLL